MNIRRDRTHQCGLTNLDFRTKGEADMIEKYHPTLKYADFGTMGKSQFKRMTSAGVDFKEKLRLTGGWQTMSNKLNPNPRNETTTEFYKMRNKKSKAPVQIGKKKETELEDNKWTD